MAIDPQIKAMLLQTVSWEAESAASIGTYGDPTYGTAASISARVVFRKSIVVGSDGQEVASDVSLLTESAIGIRDRLTLPGETVKRTPKSIARCTDEAGATPYFVVFC